MEGAKVLKIKGNCLGKSLLTINFSLVEKTSQIFITHKITKVPGWIRETLEEDMGGRHVRGLSAEK